MMAQLIEKGDLRGAEAELAESTAVAEELQQAVPLWECISTKALVALATGRFTEAESLSEQAAAIGQRALPDAAVAIHEMQRAALLEFRGRLEEAAPAVRTLADSWPSRPVFRCALTYVEARLGHLEAAAAVLEELSRDRFAVVPFDQEWLYAMSFAAEAATLTGARDAAADLYDLLLPWSDLTAADVGEGFRGSVSRYVGLVAAATDRHEEADRSYEHALVANERMGARPWLALTQHDYGTLLLARPGADHVRGRELVERAAASFRELGMVAGV